MVKHYHYPGSTNLQVYSELHDHTRPDLVVWNDRERTAVRVELTVPFETEFEEAISRKINRYYALSDERRKNGFDAKLITIEKTDRSKGIHQYALFSKTVSTGNHNEKDLVHEKLAK